MGQQKIGAEDESAVKAVGAFAGGIASSGNVCGIMLGGVALVSCLYSRGNLDKKENPRMWSLARKFTRLFEEMTEPFGGIECRKIAEVDWYDKDSVREYYSNPDSTRQRCIKLVGDAAFALGELLEKEMKVDEK